MAEARLVINLGVQAQDDLDMAVAFDGNKTLATQRALRLYAMVLQAQSENVPVFVGDTKVVFL